MPNDIATLADGLNDLSTQVADYLFDNLNALSDDQKAALDGLQSKLYHWATALVSADIQATAINMQGAQASLTSAAQTLNSEASKLDAARKIIGIATGAVSLAQAIATGSVSGVSTAIQAIASAIRSGAPSN